MLFWRKMVIQIEKNTASSIYIIEQLRAFVPGADLDTQLMQLKHCDGE